MAKQGLTNISETVRGLRATLALLVLLHPVADWGAFAVSRGLLIESSPKFSVHDR